MFTLSNKTKGILTVIAGFLVQLINGALYTWSALNSYMISHIHDFHPDVNVELTNFLLPLIQFSQAFTVFLGFWLFQKFGARM